MTERNNLMLRLAGKEGLQALFESAVLGYMKNLDAIPIQKFARFTLANNVLSLCASFNNPDPFLDTPAPLYLVSTSAADTQTIRIEYLTQDRDLAVLNVALTGQTPVALGVGIYCVYRMINISSAPLAGRASVTSDEAPAGGNPADAVTFCEIPFAVGSLGSFNQSSTGVFSVPRGYCGIVVRIASGVNKGADMTAAAEVRRKGGAFRVTTTLDVYQTTRERTDFSRLDPETDIKPMAIAQTGGDGFIEYDLVLVKVSLLDRYL